MCALPVSSLFVFVYLFGALTYACISIDIQRILELKELSAAGAKQLATDISYLCNFLTGLSIQHDPALVRLVELLPLSPAEYTFLVFFFKSSLIVVRLKEVPRSPDDRLQTVTESFIAIRTAKPSSTGGIATSAPK